MYVSFETHQHLHIRQSQYISAWKVRECDITTGGCTNPAFLIRTIMLRDGGRWNKEWLRKEVAHRAKRSSCLVGLFVVSFCTAITDHSLPALDDVKEAQLEANSWLINSKPFLVSTSPPDSLQKVEDLQVDFLSCLFYLCWKLVHC